MGGTKTSKSPFHFHTKVPIPGIPFLVSLWHCFYKTSECISHQQTEQEKSFALQGLLIFSS
jgi:hypothetical protein